MVGILSWLGKGFWFWEDSTQKLGPLLGVDMPVGPKAAIFI